MFIHRQLLPALFCGSLIVFAVLIVRLSLEPRYKGVAASEWRERVRKRVDEEIVLSDWKPGPEFLDAAECTDPESFSVLRMLLNDSELLIREEAILWFSHMEPETASKALPDLTRLLEKATDRGEIRGEIMLIGNFGDRAKSAIPLLRKIELSRDEYAYIRQLANETIQKIERAK